MDTCIFCKIVKGEIPAFKVSEDEQTMAFLTKGPIRPGHTLVIPKKHNPDFDELDTETYQAMMLTVHKTAKLLKAKLKPKRVGLIIAGWDVPHAHVHVVPIEERTDITSKVHLDGTLVEPSVEEYQMILRKITG